jgi:hypothetical protein
VPAYLSFATFAGTSCSGTPILNSFAYGGCWPVGSSSMGAICTNKSFGLSVTYYYSRDCSGVSSQGVPLSSTYPLASGCVPTGDGTSTLATCETGSPPAPGPGLSYRMFSMHSNCTGPFFYSGNTLAPSAYITGPSTFDCFPSG